MKSLKEIEKDIEAVREEMSPAVNKLAALNALKAQALRRQYVVCKDSFFKNKGCKRKTMIDKLTYIQTHWYVEPTGCMGGGYWKEGEGKYICPKCGFANRLIYEREYIAKKKRLFKEIIQEHKD
jgi:predicted  nucleic acid-binding Zn ribbon protein